MSLPFKTGVCYYPEHWPETVWADDAARMVNAGLSVVRIGEFSWSRIEPKPGVFEWDWLDRSVETLGAAGLEIMFGTPTATPPKWLIDADPSILAYDSNGQPRRFGSRRHYCFSSQRYRVESARIVEAVTSRYGQHSSVVSWQTDNEFGCHDTVRSYSPSASLAFRTWLADKYGNVATLNDAWGNVFWSQEYQCFDEIDLPNQTVTEANPSHVLDFFRFSSDQVISYHKMQVEIIHRNSPNRDIVHNVMGFSFDFDHFDLGRECDVVGWDSYPLGFLDVGPFTNHDKDQFRHQGHPDIAGFHHDLYRACGNGRWSVLEQQPGPVNWAAHNPCPLEGMVSLWTQEAYAHGAEAVQYFRWRQAPFAQEQMHAGLLRPDYVDAPGLAEAEAALLATQSVSSVPALSVAQVAIVFSYEAHWVYETHPQGQDWNYSRILFDWYTALRSVGWNVDFVEQGASLELYALVIVPSVPIVTEALMAAIKNTNAQIVFGVRSGSKTKNLSIPKALAPGAIQTLMPFKVVRSESRPFLTPIKGHWEEKALCGLYWLDHIEWTSAAELSEQNGAVPLILEHGRYFYLTTHPDTEFFAHLFARLSGLIGLPVIDVPDGVRRRETDEAVFWFNYNSEAINLPVSAFGKVDVIFGTAAMPPASVTITTKPK